MGSEKRLLIVDDSYPIRNFLSSMLADRGFSVETAPDGMEAQEMLEKNRYDILLIDLNMPVVNGIELYQRIEGRNPHIESKIIFMSADSPGSRMRRFFTNINRPFLQKPFTINDFLNAAGS